jgi:hypothetical protein
MKSHPHLLLDFEDRGHHADPAKPTLLSKAHHALITMKLSPRIGTEVTELQLSATDARTKGRARTSGCQAWRCRVPRSRFQGYRP